MSEAMTLTDIPPRVRIGTAYSALFRWQFARIGPLLPVVIVIQLLMGGGLVIGFGFLIPDIDPATALYLSTGIPTILLLTFGLVLLPSVVGYSKTEGTFGYQRTLPVPRPLVFLADLTVWSLVALPAIGVALTIAWWRFDLDLAFNWPLLVAVGALVTVTAAAVGYMIAVVLPPMLTQVVSQALVFFVLLFSPISFPATQLPGWFQAVHEVLPFQPAADLLRSAMAKTAFSADLSDLVVVVVWCVLGVGVSMTALVRRS